MATAPIPKPENPMTTSPIMPTIGRIVLVRCSTIAYMGGQPEMPAIVTAVHDLNTISVTAMPFNGNPYPLASIRYHQDDIPPDGYYTVWRWMPYQLETAVP